MGPARVTAPVPRDRTTGAPDQSAGVRSFQNNGRQPAVAGHRRGGHIVREWGRLASASPEPPFDGGSAEAHRRAEGPDRSAPREALALGAEPTADFAPWGAARSKDRCAPRAHGVKSACPSGDEQAIEALQRTEKAIVVATGVASTARSISLVLDQQAPQRVSYACGAVATSANLIGSPTTANTLGITGVAAFAALLGKPPVFW
jgi:hypothetical protein